MRIAKIEAVPVEFKLKHVTAIAYEAAETAQNIIVRVETDAGLTGWGAAAPDARVTGETAGSVLAVINEQFVPSLIGEDASMIRSIWDELNQTAPGNPAAIAAIDIALHDLRGKSRGQPLARTLGRCRESIPTFVTLGIEATHVSIARAKEYCAAGFRALKVKCGLSPQGDVERVLAIRAAVGSEIMLAIDANQGYDTNAALWVANKLRDAAIAFFEQPTAAYDLDSLAAVARKSPLPVMADESVLSAQDVSRILCSCGVQLVNIKLMKIGGITGAMLGIAKAEAAGVPVMLGCMDESVISISAAAHLALSQSGVAHADLDGHLDIISDVAGGGVILRDGLISASEEPGLGVQVRRDVSEVHAERVLSDLRRS